MTLSEIENQLKRNGYSQEQINGLVITSLPRRYIKGFGKDSIMMAHILLIDGVIVKDRTGILVGKRSHVSEFI